MGVRAGLCLALAMTATAAAASDEPTFAADADIVNGRAAALIALEMGAPTVAGYSARLPEIYLKPGASMTVPLAGGSCEQTVVAKFADGAGYRRAVNVCFGPVTLGN